MSNLVPFTPEGVRQKQEELYQLSDPALLEQARLISTDCRAWVEDNFELSDAQKDYYSNVPETINFIWGAQISAAIMSRGIINMAPWPEETARGRTKQIDVEDTGDTSYNPANPPLRQPLRQNSGGHVVNITWKWV